MTSLSSPSSLLLAVLLLGCSAGSETSDSEGNSTASTSGGTGGSTIDGPSGGASTGGTTATGGVLGSGGSATGGTGTGGEGTGGTSPIVPATTTLDGVTYEVISCGDPLPANSQLVFGPGITSFGGWSHANNATYSASYTGLRSDDRTVYDFTDKTKAVEAECGGDETLRRTLIRKIHEHTQKHSNGLQVQGTFPNMSTVSALIMDVKLGDGSHLPPVAPIFDGFATVKIETDGTSETPRYRIDPVYQGHWIRITIPVAHFGTGTPAKLQHVAETTDDGKIDESVFDFLELDLNVHQMAFVGL